MDTTVGQIIINDMLPEDMRDYNRVWDKKTKGKVLTELARRHPDRFKEVSHNLLRFGAKAAYETGGQSFGIEDITPTKVSQEFQKDMSTKMQDIMQRAYSRGKNSQDPAVEKEIVDAASPWLKKIDAGIDKELGFENPFYRQAFGTGAQKPGTLRSIVGADIFYVDQNNKRVPLPVTHGYAQGLTPAEYFIQSFGTRKGMVDLQKATQDSGFLSKQLVQIAHRLVVTDKEDSDPNSFDPNMPVGYPVETDDPDNEGAFLAQDIGGYKRNTLLTPKVLGDLKSRGFKNILIRSVMVGGPANGGVYAYDCGIREKGTLPSKGDFVGINAVQSISEPLTQGAISSKHSGGVAGADSGKAISGFKYINQLIQVPKHFQGGAVHSELDGIVGKIEDAPQGGKYIYVSGVPHYVGRDENGDIPIKVKSGDIIEAGDVMTEGIPNPAMIVKYKGIGEGRRYFTNMFREALNNAGTPIHRRNIEALSRGLINYVRLNDEFGDYAPDDIIPYSMIEKDYQPRKDAIIGSPTSLEKCYLERPVLHYSIGTQLRPSVIKELQKYGIKNVIAHKDPPPFESEMIRGMAHVSYDPDWATRLLGAYNKDSLLEGARRGATSSATSTSYVPAITFGNDAFGHIGPLKQY